MLLKKVIGNNNKNIEQKCATKHSNTNIYTLKNLKKMQRKIHTFSLAHDTTNMLSEGKNITTNFHCTLRKKKKKSKKLGGVSILN